MKFIKELTVLTEVASLDWHEALPETPLNVMKL